MKRHKSIKKFSKTICVTAICFSLLPKEHLLADDAYPFVNENFTAISNEGSTTIPDESSDNDFDEDPDKISDENSDKTSDEDSDEPIYYQTQPDSIGYYADGVDLEEIYDPTEQVALLERDDFYNDEDYLDYLRRNNVPEDYIQAHLLNENEAESEITSVASVNAKPLYSFDLKKTNAIQSFDIVGDDIYISQVYERAESHDGSLFADECPYKYKYVRISKCKLSGGFYKEVGSMLLQDVGHGQTLNVYEHNKKTYLLVSCGACQQKKKCKPWSTQIGRIEFKADTTVHNSTIKRLIYLNYSNKGAKSFGKTKRVDATLSTDKTSLLIWKRNRSKKDRKGEKDRDEFSVYDFKKINEIFDHSSSKTISFKENEELKAACRSSNRKARKPISMQGLALSDTKNSPRFVCMSSGNEDHAVGGDFPGNNLYCFSPAGNFQKMLNIRDGGVWNGYGSAFEDQDVTAEIEGARITEKDIQFVLRNTTQPEHQVIAKIPRSLLEQKKEGK